MTAHTARIRSTLRNSWTRPLLIGLAVLVLGAAVVGSTSNTIANTVGIGRLEVKVETIKEDVDENSEVVQGIDVMAEQINDIKEDVGKILEALKK